MKIPFKKFPLGMKLLLIYFAIFTAYYILASTAFMPDAETPGYTSSILLGIALRNFIMVALCLLSLIGLFGLKKWGIVCAAIHFILEGIAFSVNFGISFVKSSGLDSVAVKASTILVPFFIICILIVLLIRYLKTRFNKLQSDV